MKRIGIDSLPILANLDQGTGISKYITSLVKRLFRLDGRNSYVFFNRIFRKKSRQALSMIDERDFPDYHSQNIRLPDRVFDWMFAKGASRIAEAFYFRNIDAYISTCYFTPELKKSAVISFVYDLSPLCTQTFPPDYRQSFFNLVRRTVERSSYLLTISECSKRDLINHFDFNPDRIDVIYPGAEDDFKPLNQDKLAPILKKYGVDCEYILYVGIRGKHKNVTTLLEVFSRLKREVRLPHKLVFCGRRDFSNDETETAIKNIITRDQLENEVILTGFVPDEDLPAIYNGAALFVFPSLYEGFGMPPLEAMACGVPVIVSDSSSLPEVVGDAGIKVDPKNQKEMFQSIREVLENENLRKDMRTKGLQRAKMFSFERSARNFLDVIERWA